MSGSESFTFHAPGLTTNVDVDQVVPHKPLQDVEVPGAKQKSTRHRRTGGWGVPSPLLVQPQSEQDNVLASSCTAHDQVLTSWQTLCIVPEIGN